MTQPSTTPSMAPTEFAMTVYCPACGESNDAATLEILAPGNFEWTCRECSTLFRIEIGFVPLGEADDD